MAEGEVLVGVNSWLVAEGFAALKKAGGKTARIEKSPLIEASYNLYSDDDPEENARFLETAVKIEQAYQGITGQPQAADSYHSLSFADATQIRNKLKERGYATIRINGGENPPKHIVANSDGDIVLYYKTAREGDRDFRVDGGVFADTGNPAFSQVIQDIAQELEISMSVPPVTEESVLNHSLASASPLLASIFCAVKYGDDANIMRDRVYHDQTIYSDGSNADRDQELLQYSQKVFGDYINIDIPAVTPEGRQAPALQDAWDLHNILWHEKDNAALTFCEHIQNDITTKIIANADGNILLSYAEGINRELPPDIYVNNNLIDPAILPSALAEKLGITQPSAQEETTPPPEPLPLPQMESPYNLSLGPVDDLTARIWVNIKSHSHEEAFNALYQDCYEGGILYTDSSNALYDRNILESCRKLAREYEDTNASMTPDGKDIYFLDTRRIQEVETLLRDASLHHYLHTVPREEGNPAIFISDPGTASILIAYTGDRGSNTPNPVFVRDDLISRLDPTGMSRELASALGVSQHAEIIPNPVIIPPDPTPVTAAIIPPSPRIQKQLTARERRDIEQLPEYNTKKTPKQNSAPYIRYGEDILVLSESTNNRNQKYYSYDTAALLRQNADGTGVLEYVDWKQEDAAKVIAHLKTLAPAMVETEKTVTLTQSQEKKFEKAITKLRETLPGKDIVKFYVSKEEAGESKLCWQRETWFRSKELNFDIIGTIKKTDGNKYTVTYQPDAAGKIDGVLKNLKVNPVETSALEEAAPAVSRRHSGSSGTTSRTRHEPVEVTQQDKNAALGVTAALTGGFWLARLAERSGQEKHREAITGVKQEVTFGRVIENVLCATVVISGIAAAVDNIANGGKLTQNLTSAFAGGK